MNGGLGGVWSSARPSTGDVKVSGGMGLASVTVGGAVAPNFIVGAQWWELAAIGDVEVDGQAAGGNAEAALALFGIGLNLTYYFMPANVFVSVTPSFQTMVLAGDLRTSDTERGFALRLAAGKEWWVSDNWGLGVSVVYAYGVNAGRDGGPTWKTNSFGAAFSATYN